MTFANFISVRYPKIFCKGITRIKTNSPALFLSFDDGPNPTTTEKVLSLLKKHNARAIFFCTGENANKYPEILEKIKAEGHTIGNHSYSHKNALKVSNERWLSDVYKKSPVSESEFFRPPYGKILPWQSHQIRKKYKLVFWDVLSFDYRRDLTSDRICEILRNKVRNGSIIVFHDSVKAAPNMFPALEFTLEHFSSMGFGFKSL